MDKVIVGRHIRWDWQTFVEWEQKSVRTLCGVTSQARLCGVPTITEQPEIVKGRWGWCGRCAVQAYRISEDFLINSSYDDSTMRYHYESVNKLLRPYWHAWLEAQSKGRFKIADPVVK